MSAHPSYLLGQALAALARVEAADSLTAAHLAASEALAAISPAVSDLPGVARGARIPFERGAAGRGVERPGSARQGMAWKTASLETNGVAS